MLISPQCRTSSLGSQEFEHKSQCNFHNAILSLILNLDATLGHRKEKESRKHDQQYLQPRLYCWRQCQINLKLKCCVPLATSVLRISFDRLSLFTTSSFFVYYPLFAFHRYFMVTTFSLLSPMVFGRNLEDGFL